MQLVPLIFKLLNLILSAATVGYGTYAASGSVEGSVVAGMGAAVQHMRENPVSANALENIKGV